MAIDPSMEPMLEVFIYESTTLLDQLDEILLDSEKEKQSRIQWKIADFLCKTYLKGKAEVSESMRGESSRLVRFVRKYGKWPDEEIKISDLVNLNRNEIFHDKEA